METKLIMDYRSKHTVLTKPLNLGDLKNGMNSEGVLSAKVVVPLSEIINGNVETLNDTVSQKIVGSSVGMTDISLNVAGRTTSNEVILKVTGSVKDFVTQGEVEEDIQNF